MKKLLVLFVVLVLAMGFVACSDDDDGGSVTYTGTVTMTLPIGTPRTFAYKLATTAGWDNGEEAANQTAILTADAATQTVSNVFAKYVADKSVDTNTITYPTVSAPAAGNLKIALWLNGALDPGSNDVYILGALGDYTNVGTGASLATWSDNANNIMTDEGNGLYTIEIVKSNDATYTGALEFKFSNWDGATGNVWGGETQFGNGVLTMVNGAMASFTNDGSKGFTASYAIQNSGSTIVIDIGNQGSWSVPVAGNITVASTVTFIWSGIPSTHDNNGNVWANVNDGTAVITGALTNFHSDGTSTWEPSLGAPVTLTAQPTVQ